MAEQTSGRFVVVKNWHCILTLLAWLAMAVAQFVTLQSHAEETARRVQALEEKKVEQKQFDELKEDILRRLQRIEDKLDSQSTK